MVFLSFRFGILPDRAAYAGCVRTENPGQPPGVAALWALRLESAFFEGYSLEAVQAANRAGRPVVSQLLHGRFILFCHGLLRRQIILYSFKYFNIYSKI